MAGRRPKPTALKLISGNPGKRPLPENEPEPEIKIPEPPDHIDGIALVEWNRISKELFKLKLLSEIDRTALEGYCAAYQLYTEARQELKKHGMAVETARGGLMKSPYAGIMVQALDQVRRYLIEFGMTPASRTKVSTPKGEKKKNEWSDF